MSWPGRVYIHYRLKVLASVGPGEPRYCVESERSEASLNRTCVPKHLGGSVHTFHLERNKSKVIPNWLSHNRRDIQTHEVQSKQYGLTLYHIPLKPHGFSCVTNTKSSMWGNT